MTFNTIFVGKPENCQDVYKRGHTSSGIYTIYLWNECDKTFRSVDVFCDMETSDGGWTVSFNNCWPIALV